MLECAEGACAKLGKVRRIKFYKNERGGLKGDAVVTFSSRATMTKAIDKVKLSSVGSIVDIYHGHEKNGYI